MASVINTNISSLNSQRNLSVSQSSLANSLQRLSSGLRVNSAKDDAAGLSIATRMDSQVRGMSVGMRNASDAISFAQTAEGGLSKITDALQRMRELAVQSANATNNTGDRSNIATEFKQLQAEIGRLAGNTTAVPAVTSATPAVTEQFTAAFVGDETGDDTTIAFDGVTVTLAAGDNDGTAIADKFLATYNADTNATYTGVNSGGTITFTKKTAETTTVSKTAADFTITANTADATAVAVTVNETRAGVTGVAISDAIPVSEGTQFNGTNTLAGGTLTFQVGANATDRISITGTDFSRANLTSKVQVAIASNVGVDTADNALSAITSIEDALSEVNTARANFGAIQNRFESVIGNLQISSENVTAAKSRIMDADFAAETANLTRGQILQQAGTAMLAQANSLPNGVLALLRG